MGGCPYCFGSGKVVVWKEVDRDEETVTIQSSLETCSECNGSGFGKIETKEIYTESDVKNAFDDGYQAGYEAAQPKWISTEERLPDKPGDVLICLFGKSCVAYYHKNRCFETRSGVAWWSKKDVTHWMPLPEAPKEET